MKLMGIVIKCRLLIFFYLYCFRYFITRFKNEIKLRLDELTSL